LDSEEDPTFQVVVNDEGQYSILPPGRDNAPGWRQVGKNGSKADCLAYIQIVWTDLKPLSLRAHEAPSS
jgi:MbtH protein